MSGSLMLDPGVRRMLEIRLKIERQTAERERDVARARRSLRDSIIARVSR